MKSDDPARLCESACHRSRGFTLVEVVVAVAVFAFAVVVLAGSYVDVLNSMERVKVDQELEQELAFVRSQVLLQPELEEVELGGEVPTATHGRADWRATVTPSERVADLFRVDLEINLEGDGEAVEPQKIEQTLYLLRPDWSEPTDRENIRSLRRQEIEEAKRYRSL